MLLPPRWIIGIAGTAALVVLLSSYLYVDHSAAVPYTSNEVVQEFRGWPHFYAVVIEDRSGRNPHAAAKAQWEIQEFALDDQWPIGTWSLLWLLVDWLVIWLVICAVLGLPKTVARLSNKWHRPAR